MKIFRKKGEDIYIVTNYKVMYSTFRYQNNLIRLNPSKIHYLEVIKSWISPTSKFYLVVRNP